MQVYNYTKIITISQPKSNFRIADWELPSGEILAPMAGITDSPYRRLARRRGAGLLYTECISAEGVRRLGQASLDLARFQEEERPIAVQLFGSRPDQFADAAAVIEHRFAPDMIDINCGCPVKKFVTRSCGGWLMQEPDLIGRIVEAVRRSTGLPVSVKLRAGYRKPDETAAEAAVAAEEAGASLVAVHARFVRKARGLPAEWDVIGRVKDAVRKVPVVGNGDVVSFTTAREMVASTGCDRVMIARWACGRPWIFEALRESYPLDGEVVAPSHYARINLLLEHYHYMLNHFDVRRAVHRMRKHTGWYTVGMPNSAKLRKAVMTMEDPEEIMRTLRRFQIKLSRKPRRIEQTERIIVAEEDD